MALQVFAFHILLGDKQRAPTDFSLLLCIHINLLKGSEVDDIFEIIIVSEEHVFLLFSIVILGFKCPLLRILKRNYIT